MTIKRFLLFAGDNYYPGGGWQDFKGSFDTLEEAESAETSIKGFDWFQIVDLEKEIEIEG